MWYPTILILYLPTINHCKYHNQSLYGIQYFYAIQYITHSRASSLPQRKILFRKVQQKKNFMVCMIKKSCPYSSKYISLVTATTQIKCSSWSSGLNIIDNHESRCVFSRRVGRESGWVLLRWCIYGLLECVVGRVPVCSSVRHRSHRRRDRVHWTVVSEWDVFICEGGRSHWSPRAGAISHYTSFRRSVRMSGMVFTEEGGKYWWCSMHSLFVSNTRGASGNV